MEAGIIQTKTGPISFHMLLTDGDEQRCHQDQIQLRIVEIWRSDTPVELENIPIPTAHEAVSSTAIIPTVPLTASPPAAEPHSIPPPVEES